MHAALNGTEICVFDAYGTLYDFNSAVARHKAAIGPKDRKSTRLNSSHVSESRMPSSA